MSGPQALYSSFANQPEKIELDAKLVAETKVESWAMQFKLGTAGYRDLLDPENFFNFDVPFNGVSAALILEARAQLADENGISSLHIGGEVRPHTQEFIDLAARIYTAHGISVHLRPKGMRTTPIWLSSFGVFYNELDGGENFTASHSQNYKGGWKPMEAAGGQLLEMAGQIADRVRDLVTEAKTNGITIHLAASGNDLFHYDFDPVDAYVEVLKKIVPASLISEIAPATAKGFRAGFCTEGGSMAPTARRIFEALNVTMDEGGSVFFTHEEESDTFHGIGILDGVNHGVDPGKWQVYKNVGAQELLRNKECDVFFIWDPDGDRFNMVTVAPAAQAQDFLDAGLEVDPLDDERCFVFFKPNQIYFMLTALKIQSLEEAGELGNYNWIVASTFPTSMSIGEVATTFNKRSKAALATYRVPVGFKYFASLVGDLEKQLAVSAAETQGTAEISAIDVTGVKTVFGTKPRLLMMAEESGGAAMGPAEPVSSRTGKNTSLAAKEKDAMQIGLMSLCLGARLHSQGGSFAAYYLQLLEEFETRYRFYERRDVTLFDESLKGAERDAAKEAGNTRKDDTVAFFGSLENKTPAEVTAILVDLLPEGTSIPEIKRVFHAGDGTFIEFEDQWFELRASGTDAVLRYYMEGRFKEKVTHLNAAFEGMTIPK